MVPVLTTEMFISHCCWQAAEAKAKYCASRVVRGVDFTRTGSYVEYDRPASVDNCCHACAGQQVRGGRCLAPWRGTGS